MQYLDVRIRQPDWMLHPMQAFVRETDVVRYEEMVTWNVRPEAGVEYHLFYVEVRDVDRYREAVSSVDSLLEYNIVQVDEGSLHVWACQETRPTERELRHAFADRRLVVVPPICFDAQAAMRITVVGAGEDVRDLLADLPDDIDVSILGTGTYDRQRGTPAGALTDRQLEALETALRLGYYDVPRAATLADVAGAMGCAQSTASVLLRRAERNVLERVVDRHGTSAPDAVDDPPTTVSRE